MSVPIVGQEYCLSQEDAKRYGDVWRWDGERWWFNAAKRSRKTRIWGYSGMGAEFWCSGKLVPYNPRTIVAHDLHALAMALELADLLQRDYVQVGINMYFENVAQSRWLRAEVIKALREMAS